MKPVGHRSIMNDKLPSVFIEIEEESESNVSELTVRQGIQRELLALGLQEEAAVGN